MVQPNTDPNEDAKPVFAFVWAMFASFWNTRLAGFLSALIADVKLGFVSYTSPLEGYLNIARNGLPLPNLTEFLSHDPTSSPGRYDRAQTFGQMMLLVVGAVVVGVTIITLLMMELIAGEFADAIDVDNSFSDAADNTTAAGETAFNVMGQATLVIPVVVVVVLLIGGLIGALSIGGVTNGGGGLSRR